MQQRVGQSDNEDTKTMGVGWSVDGLSLALRQRETSRLQPHRLSAHTCSCRRALRVRFAVVRVYVRWMLSPSDSGPAGRGNRIESAARRRLRVSLLLLFLPCA